VRARWTAILAAALAITAWNTDWPAAWGETRALVPAVGDRTAWDARALTTAPALDDTTGLTDGIDDPAEASTARLETDDAVLDLLWEAPLALAEVRLETYTDLLGTGFRLGLAADSTTKGGPHCVNARITRNAERTLAQWCSRADQHEPVDMNAFLGKEDDDRWQPDQLYITQTANLDPPAGAPRLVDFYGFGLTTGNAYETGLWPANYWIQGENSQVCDDPLLRHRLDDLHLTDRYNDPAAHQRSLELLHTPQTAFPAEHRLLTPACSPIGGGHGSPWVAAGPFLTDTSTPMAGVYPFNASTRDARPVHTAFVLDLRTCEAATTHCTSDEAAHLTWANDGTGRTWMNELLELRQ
jgi:hypothetical protein